MKIHDFSENKIFIPFSEKLEFPLIDEMKDQVDGRIETSDDFVLPIDCKKGENIISMLERKKNEILGILGEEFFSVLKGADLGQLHLIELEKIRMMDKGFVEGELNAKREVFAFCINTPLK